jgi:hypothetical protein
MEMSDHLQRSSRFTPGKRAPGAHWIGGWMSPTAGFDTMEKREMSYLCLESTPNSLLVQNVASRNTN